MCFVNKSNFIHLHCVNKEIITENTKKDTIINHRNKETI